MKKKITKNQYHKMIKQAKDKHRKDLSDRYQKLVDLANNKNNTVIKYPEYNKAYDYVESKFPGLNVLNVTIYKVRKQDLIAADLGGVGGLYIPGKKAVLVSDLPSGGSTNTYGKKAISASLTIDEVIVHELLHYVSHKFYRTHDVMMEEEFAYGHSVPYLLSKGHTKEEIIRYNMLPFLYGAVNHKKLLSKILEEKKIKSNTYNSYLRKIDNKTAGNEIIKVINNIKNELHERTIELATKKGEFLVDTYDSVPDGEVNDDNNEYDLEI